MKIRIGIPDNPFYKDLTENFEKIKDNDNLQILRLPDEELEDFVLNHRVDLALINPITYGRGVRRVDFRIVPEACVVAQGYTEMLSLQFNAGLDSISTCGAPDKSFLVQMAKILMMERYDIKLDLDVIKDEQEKVLTNHDASITYGRSENSPSSFDITEDWLDQFKYPLVLGFWVVFNEEEPEGVNDFINILKADNIGDEKLTRSKDDTFKLEGREGKLIYKWDDNVEASLHLLIELLYQYKLIPEMAAVKLLDRD